MPEVQPTEQSNEEIQQQTETQESLHSNVLDKIKSGNVFKSLDQDLPKAEPEAKEEVQPQQEEEQTQEETQEDTQDEEEVVPKSKIQPRIDQLTAKLKAQQAEIDELRTHKNTPTDETQRQLDAASENELEDYLIQVRVAKEESRSDPTKLTELVKLERRIEKSIVQAPQKFVQNQVKEFNNTVQRLAGDGEITDANYSKILETAKGIYDKYPKMQKAVDGQAMALELALEHYKQVGRTSIVKTETNNLKGQINTLKKKTALDTKAVKGAGQSVNLDKLRNNAYNGTMKDKEKFAQNDPRFKIDAMIPDFLKG